MEIGEPGLADKAACVRSHLLGLGRETGDEIGAEGGIGAQAAHLVAEVDRMLAQMAALHALEDHVVAGLHRQMEMRHQPLFLGDGAQEGVVGFDGIDGGDAQALQFGHQLQDLLHQLAEAGRARQIGTIGGEIDACQHEFREPGLDQPARFVDHRAHRHAARVPAAIGNNAEGAAMIAAILHLQEGAGAAFETVHELCRGFGRPT